MWRLLGFFIVSGGNVSIRLYRLHAEKCSLLGWYKISGRRTRAQTMEAFGGLLRGRAFINLFSANHIPNSGMLLKLSLRHSFYPSQDSSNSTHEDHNVPSSLPTQWKSQVDVHLQMKMISLDKRRRQVCFGNCHTVKISMMIKMDYKCRLSPVILLQHEISLPPTGE